MPYPGHHPQPDQWCFHTHTHIHTHTHTHTLSLSQPQVTQADECQIRVTILNQTFSGQHKFKVIGIIVSDQASKDASE
jgi:hypothetical protein